MTTLTPLLPATDPQRSASTATSASAGTSTAENDAIRQSAEELAVTFTIEMLKAAEFDKALTTTDDAAEVMQMPAVWLEPIAEEMVAADPTLADRIYNSLKSKEESA